MPKLVTLPDVLREVYVWGKMDDSNEVERPLSYKNFKRVMLGSETIVTEKTIRQKYEQILAAGFARESKVNPEMIILHIPQIREYLVTERMITPAIDGAHTQTHTEGIL